MKTKIWLILAAIILVMGLMIKSLHEDKQRLKREKAGLESQLSLSLKESRLKAEAFAEREQSLIKDREELQNEFQKLLELRKTEEHYSSWGDAALPDSVSQLML